MMKYCPKCGQPIQNGHKFCGKCGAALTAPASKISGAKNVSGKSPAKKLTLAAQATRNEKPSMASQAVVEAQKRETFMTASLKEKYSILDNALQSLIQEYVPKLPQKKARSAAAA